MGLISWIKNKYYDHKLKQADKFVANRDFSRALQIYESLLGKQTLACAHLAKVLVDNASSVSEKLDVLNRLVVLRPNVSKESSQDFNDTLLKHVASIETLADQCFSAANYADAVNLIASIDDFKGDQKHIDKVNRYKAYYRFSLANEQPLNTTGLYEDAVDSLKQLSYAPADEIKDLIEILQKQQRYARGIRFLIQLQEAGVWIKSIIFDYIVKVISNEDSELKDVNRYSDFCTDQKICSESASDLYQRSLKKALNRDFATAVLFDKFASEYLSENNGFNFDRCCHIVEELSKRANASEIKHLLSLANSLNLTPSQLFCLNNRIKEIAVDATPVKAVAICRLFIGTTTFDKVYLEKALSLAKSGIKLYLAELLRVIGNQTDAVSFPKALAPFVAYEPALENEFVETAIIAIRNQHSPALLDEYWKVKSDCRFFNAFVEKSFEYWAEFADHIANEHRLYLFNQEYLLAFCNALRDTDDLDVVLKISENLLSNQKDVNDFYVTSILKFSHSYSNAEKSLDLVNRGLAHEKKDILERLLLEKKALISQIIEEKNYERAEVEITSILDCDTEAPTLLAELYFQRYENSETIEDRIQWLYKILDVNEEYSLFGRFSSDLQVSLSGLCDIAIKLSKSGEIEKGGDIANRISDYYHDWIPLYAEIRELGKDTELTLNESILYDVDTLKTIRTNCPTCKEYDSVQFKSLWDGYSAKLIEKSKSLPLPEGIARLSALRNTMMAYAPSSFVNEKEEELSRLIARLKWELANVYEHDLSFGDAIMLYNEIVYDNVQSYVIRAELRCLICHVKAKELDATIELRIYTALKFKSYQALREDLAYRFSCYLLEQMRPVHAKRLLREYLPDEQTLLDICENLIIKEAEIHLDEFNQKVKKLNEGKMSVAEAFDFKISLWEYKRLISRTLTDTATGFYKFRPLINAYILSKMFEEEAYMDILDELQDNPDYLEDDIDFQNIAIASFGILESDIEDESVLKRAIATCLTAIYTDRLFVNRLYHTSWSDKFEFTLVGSLGNSSFYDYKDLPKNVNFDSSDENRNVSIRAVQDSLISQLEASVRKYHPELESFFNSEKDALDRIIELRLDESYILASPYLCRTLDSVRMSIENAFKYELDQDYDNREEVIALGCEYGLAGGEYCVYSVGARALQQCKNALTPQASNSVENAYNRDRILQIKRYTRLISDLKSAVATAMNSDIKNEMNYKRFLDKYEIVCRNIEDNTLSLTCSNYVNVEVVYLLNENKMELRDGVGYMVRIYNIAPDNFQVKTNLEGILCNLATQAECNGLVSDKNALEKAMRDTGNAFKTAVDDAVVQSKLSVIIDGFNAGTMRHNKALSELKDIYLRHPNNQRVCENLATICEICIFEYIINEAYGAAGVKIALNSIAKNMSPTFRTAARKLGTRFNETWKTIPYETKNLMCGGFDLEHCLSSSGESLKLGLQYLKKLGSVPRISSTELPDLPIK